ncbi:unnamed protein product [Mortierella alpina]
MATASLRCLLQPSRPIALPLCSGAHLRRVMSTWNDSEVSKFSSSSHSHSHSHNHTHISAAAEPPSGKEGKRKSKSRFTQNNTTMPSKSATNSKYDTLAQNDSGVQHDPDLYRLFFRSPDKIRSLEDAQVFISHIKSSYGPLTQYQFSRCPETKKYFGYGFLTFKHKESLDKALQDGYIRVGLKDFELIRSGLMPSKRGVIHKNYGFSGFNNLEELRAKKAQELKETAHQSFLQSAGLDGTDASSATLQRSSSTAAATPSPSPTEPFVSALNSISPTTPTSIESTSTPLQQQQQSSSSPDNSTSSKPFFVPLRKRGMVQLWKTIPDEIERAERSSKQNGDSEDGEKQSETTPPAPASRDMAAKAIGDVLNKNT